MRERGERRKGEKAAHFFTRSQKLAMLSRRDCTNYIRGRERSEEGEKGVREKGEERGGRERSEREGRSERER